ncbi:MAG: type II secretion system F family protein [Actinobacteria bacterium]|nr:type II secretion system F family protein [Actinomycetota bacterium]
MLLNIYRKSSKKRFLLLFFIFIVLCFAFYLFFENFIFGLFVGLCGIILVIDFFRGMEDRRRDLLHSQLIEFINVMIIMLKAGRTIRNIIRDSVKWLKAPLKGCVENLAKELELNFTLEDALERFSKSCGTTEAKLLVSALKINNQIGGDLIFVLNSIVDTLRSSFNIRSQIKTLTLQSRFSGNIISLFPLIVLSGLFVFMNSAVKVFFSSAAGNILLVVGGIFELLGILVMKSLLKVDS